MKTRSNYSGILVKEEIEALGLIQVPDNSHSDPNCYKHASYDLRLGNEYLLPPLTGAKKREYTIGQCQNGLLTIPAYSSVIISTYESVKLPNNVAGRFDLRIEHALRGLIVQMGTQIEPGYEGPLFALLHNISDREILLKYRHYDTRIFTVEFHYTTRSTKPVPKKRNPTLQDFLKGEPPGNSLLALKEQTNELRDEVQRLDTKRILVFSSIFLVIALAVFSIIIPYTITKLTYDKDDFPLGTAETMAKHALSAGTFEDHIRQQSYILKYLRLKNTLDSLRSVNPQHRQIRNIERQINETLEQMK